LVPVEGAGAAMVLKVKSARAGRMNERILLVSMYVLVV
jgi:hypothetical protein